MYDHETIYKGCFLEKDLAHLKQKNKKKIQADSGDRAATHAAGATKEKKHTHTHTQDGNKCTCSGRAGPAG